jgi:glycine betaine catabolism A
MNEQSSPSAWRSVLHGIETPDRIPAQRYYDPEFFELEKQRLWPHVWQMACRLEQIQGKGEYYVYRILDKSVIIIRTGDGKDEVKAYLNHCRHRGVELVQKAGRTTGGFACPFHGWRWDVEGNNTYVHEPEAFSKENMCEADLNLVEVRHEIFGGCVWINFDKDALDLRPSLGRFGDMLEAWKVEELRAEWWLAARLPVNWKLAMEAFMEGYHVAATHPQLLPPGATGKPGEHRYVPAPKGMVTTAYWLTTAAAQMPTEVDSQMFIDLNLHFMRVLNHGMQGMTHEQEIRIMESLKGLELPANVYEASVAWRRAVHKAVMEYYGDMGVPTGDLDQIDADEHGIAVNFGFPHYFILPTYGSASSYRIRPTGPEECIFELWSLTRYKPGEEPTPPREPEPMAHDDERWPDIPKQDYSNLPKQQRGLHTMEYMRLSNQMEGLISNYQRMIDGFLAGLDKETLAKGLAKAQGPIDVPVADLGF